MSDSDENSRDGFPGLKIGQALGVAVVKAAPARKDKKRKRKKRRSRGGDSDEAPSSCFMTHCRE